jgi:hypothetical protein
MLIQTSTFSGNSAYSNVGPGARSFGGAIDNPSTGSSLIEGSTFSGNSARQGATFNADRATLQLRSTILADPRDLDGNPADNCGQRTIQSLGFNLETGNSCGLNKTADQVKTDPGLRELDGNGGPTQTMAIGLSSLALDAGVDGGLKTDQRGFERPVRIDNVPKPEGGDGSDIGAYEFQKGTGGLGRRIAGKARPRRVPAGERSCVVFKARRSDGRGTGGLLRHVAVRFAGETAMTGGHGKARICVRLDRAGKRTARFDKRGFESDRAKVKVVRG